MNVDLRLPLGALFIALGVVMLVFGLLSNPAIYGKSLGINVNLWWGIVEIVFGAIMLGLSLRARRSGR